MAGARDELKTWTRYPCFDEPIHVGSGATLEVRTADLVACGAQPPGLAARGKVRFEPIEVRYRARFRLERIEGGQPLLVVPVRDQVELLICTLENLVTMGVTRAANVLVLDDRSREGAAIEEL